MKNDEYVMTVKELITELEKCDPNKAVFIDIDDKNLYQIDEVNKVDIMGEELEFNITLECIKW